MPTTVNRARVPFSMHNMRLQYILHTEEDIYPLVISFWKSVLTLDLSSLLTDLKLMLLGSEKHIYDSICSIYHA